MKITVNLSHLDAGVGFYMEAGLNHRYEGHCSVVTPTGGMKNNPAKERTNLAPLR